MSSAEEMGSCDYIDASLIGCSVIASVDNLSSL